MGVKLKIGYAAGCVEAGVDEAGRGCLAGPVMAGAVILPEDWEDDDLNDSKQLTEKKRETLRERIERHAVAWAVGVASAEEIDRINILNAAILAMHRAIDGLGVRPEHLIVDGNRFKPYMGIAHTTIVKGDATYRAIAAASILAKTHRDEYMRALDERYPMYGFGIHKGYPTKAHRKAISEYGIIEGEHRKTFRGVKEFCGDIPLMGQKTKKTGAKKENEKKI